MRSLLFTGMLVLMTGTTYARTEKVRLCGTIRTEATESVPHIITSTFLDVSAYDLAQDQFKLSAGPKASEGYFKRQALLALLATGDRICIEGSAYQDEKGEAILLPDQVTGFSPISAK